MIYKLYAKAVLFVSVVMHDLLFSVMLLTLNVVSDIVNFLKIWYLIKYRTCVSQKTVRKLYEVVCWFLLFHPNKGILW